MDVERPKYLTSNGKSVFYLLSDSNLALTMNTHVPYDIFRSLKAFCQSRIVKQNNLTKLLGIPPLQRPVHPQDNASCNNV